MKFQLLMKGETVKKKILLLNSWMLLALNIYKQNNFKLSWVEYDKFYNLGARFSSFQFFVY